MRRQATQAACSGWMLSLILGWSPAVPGATVPDAGTAPSPVAATEARVAATGDDAVSVVWKERNATFNYHSRTTLYSCSGLADKTRAILRHFGARDDIQVSVMSCGFRFDELVSDSLVRVRFMSPALAELEAVEPELVATGHWKNVTIAPNKPMGLARTECDIVESMREVLSKSFTVADPKLNLMCFGGSDLGTFAVSARVLQAVAGTEQRTGALPPGAQPRLPRGVSIQEYNYLRDGLGTLAATLYRPKTREQYPLLIYVHGGEWVRGDRSSASYIGPALAAKGVALLAIDFRMPPAAGYPASIADINFAVRWTKQNATGLGTRPDWIGLYGESSGAHQALLSSLRPRHELYSVLPLAGGEQLHADVALVIACWPVLDPAARLQLAKQRNETVTAKAINGYFDEGEAALQDADVPRLTAQLDSARPPLLLLQGQEDTYVDFHQAELYAAAYRAAGGQAQLQLFPNQPHSFIRAPFDATSKDALDKIAAFVREHTIKAP